MSLKIASWNILADARDLERRTELICRRLMEEDPDIILLQEVTHQAWLVIKKSMAGYSSAYDHPFINNTSQRAYGELILYKEELADCVTDRQFFPLRPSKEGRTCTIITVAGVQVATAHLEDIKQKSQIEERLRAREGLWFFMGDTNDDQLSIYGVPTWHGARFWDRDEVRTLTYPITNMMPDADMSVIGQEKVEGMWLSDHDGVVVHVRVPLYQQENIDGLLELIVKRYETGINIYNLTQAQIDKLLSFFSKHYGKKYVCTSWGYPLTAFFYADYLTM
jgi:hypothetical protein